MSANLIGNKLNQSKEAGLNKLEERKKNCIDTYIRLLVYIIWLFFLAEISWILASNQGLFCPSKTNLHLFLVII